MSSDDTFAPIRLDAVALAEKIGFVIGHSLSFKAVMSAGDELDVASYRSLFAGTIFDFLRQRHLVEDGPPFLDVQAHPLELPNMGPRLLFDCQVKVLSEAIPALVQDEAYGHIQIPPLGEIFVQRTDVHLPSQLVNISGVSLSLADLSFPAVDHDSEPLSETPW